MLTHHSQDPNGDPILGQAALIINGKFIARRVDLEESYSSDNKRRHSKLEKIEMEYNRIIQRNNGQLFMIKNEKRDSQGKCDQLLPEDDWSEFGHMYRQQQLGQRPLFRVKFKPRKCCALHIELANCEA